MSFTATKKLELGLVAALLFSTVPAQKAQAFAPIEKFNQLTTSQKALVIGALVMTPYLVNFFGRKPLTAPRFDSQKLLHGSVAEKCAQCHYFFVDKVLGWPRKEGKIKVAEDKNAGDEKDGKKAEAKYKLEVSIGQEPAGALGLTADYIDNAAKALGLPKKILGGVAAIIAGVQYIGKLDANIKTSLSC